MGLLKIFRKLNQREKRLFFFISLISTCILTGWLLFSASGILKYRELKKQVDLVKAENQRLQEENQLLRTKIDRIQNDPAYLEEVARGQYKLQKKNEVVFEFK
ncbi:MAG: septum formation initiator family protein [Desulfobulbaceae bacterium]|nr:septum formation initiator family protein [Desulfobulbaceae bacterium]